MAFFSFASVLAFALALAPVAGALGQANLTAITAYQSAQTAALR